MIYQNLMGQYVQVDREKAREHMNGEFNVKVKDVRYVDALGIWEVKTDFGWFPVDWIETVGFWYKPMGLVSFLLQEMYRKVYREERRKMALNADVL